MAANPSSSTFYLVRGEEHPRPHRQCCHVVLPEHMGPSDQNGTFSKTWAKTNLSCIKSFNYLMSDTHHSTYSWDEERDDCLCSAFFLLSYTFQYPILEWGFPQQLNQDNPGPVCPGVCLTQLAKLTIEITPPIRSKNHDNVALLAPHYKVPNRLRRGLFCISK